MSTLDLVEIEKILNDEWANDFLIDSSLSKSKGIIILRYPATRAPLNLGVEISVAAFEEDLISWRVLNKKIKDCLPDQIFKAHASEINQLLRNANRMSIKVALKTFDRWVSKTAEDLERILGIASAELFLTETILPPHIRPETVQALQFKVEDKIDQLKKF